MTICSNTIVKEPVVRLSLKNIRDNVYCFNYEMYTPLLPPVDEYSFFESYSKLKLRVNLIKDNLYYSCKRWMIVSVAVSFIFGFSLPILYLTAYKMGLILATGLLFGFYAKTYLKFKPYYPFLIASQQMNTHLNSDLSEKSKVSMKILDTLKEKNLLHYLFQDPVSFGLNIKNATVY